MALPWPFAVPRLVARATGDQGLPALRSHTLDPQGFVLAAWSVQVREPADVMDCTLLLGTTACTALGQETLDHLTATPAHRLGLVVDGPVPVPAEGHPAKPGTQRRVALTAFVSHLPYFERAMRGRHRGPILVEEVMPVRAMVMRERLDQRPWHAPRSPPETMGVVGHEGVLHHAPICRLVLRHEAVIRRMEARYQVGRLPVSHVWRAWRAPDLDRQLEAERTVDPAPVLGTARLVIRLLGDDVVAEPACGGRARVRDAGFLVGEGELERVAPACLPWSCDRFRCLPWATEPEQPIVGIAPIPSPTQVRVIGIPCWQALRRVAQPCSGLALPREPWLPCGVA
jgi:hypothetical protein